MRGKVKWFNEEKGFGFITCEDGKDAFVHIHELDGDNCPGEGQAVEFERTVSARGLRATGVKLLAIVLLAAVMCGMGLATAAFGQTTAPATPAVQPEQTEMIDFTAMLGSPLMIVIVTGALVQVVKKKAAEIDLLAKVPIWGYAVLIAGGLTCLATYGLGTLQGDFWPLIVNIIANALWTLGGYGLLMGLTKTPATAAAGDGARQKSGGGWASLLLPAALLGLAVTSGGCVQMSDGQQYKLAASGYKATMASVTSLSRAGYLTMADCERIEVIRLQARKAIDDMRDALIAGRTYDFDGLLARFNTAIDDLIRLELQAEALKARKAKENGIDGSATNRVRGDGDQQVDHGRRGRSTTAGQTADGRGDPGDQRLARRDGRELGGGTRTQAESRGPRQHAGTEWRPGAGLIEPAFSLAIARGDAVAAFDLISLENRLRAWWEH